MDGVKDNAGKPQMRLMLPNANAAVVLTREYGLRKYTNPQNWKSVPKEEWENALLRHLMKYLDGDEFDDESGLPHLYHALCNLSYMVELEYPGIIRGEVYDRQRRDAESNTGNPLATWSAEDDDG